MGFLNFLHGKKDNESATVLKMVTERGNSFYKWDGKLYRSETVRACIRPLAKAVGKMPLKHIRREGNDIKIFPEPYMRFLLKEPNPFMSGQMMKEKMITQLALNNNSFTLIMRDGLGMPIGLYPIPAVSAEAIYINGELYLKFLYENGKQNTFPYSDIIHLRNDFNNNDIFGDSACEALSDLMELMGTVDSGISKAIKNSGIIQWLLKFNTSLRKEDVKKNVEEFVANYMSVSSSTFGAAGIDSKVDAQRIEPKDYVPNSTITQKLTDRLYAFFNTNEKIVRSQATEDDWNSYYELVVEPIAIQLSEEFTRKLFSRKQRGFGNEIMCEASNLAFASLKTKLGLQAMVDRGALTPNEWRASFNLAPVEGGDVPLRRKDTGTVKESGEINED